jgi:hypothetical protein
MQRGSGAWFIHILVRFPTRDGENRSLDERAKKLQVSSKHQARKEDNKK